jgi:sec-independent protein translocase protein TatB
VPVLIREASSPVFGIGMQEMMIVGLLFLVIFGPSKLPIMARDVGRFVTVARRSVEEFKDDLVSEEEYGRKSRNVQGPESSGNLEETARREEVTVSDRSAERTKQRQQ